ncbi:hypothetical protein K438DRAFT_1561135, partial [Mycena galopus ATCC 62051]
MTAENHGCSRILLPASTPIPDPPLHLSSTNNAPSESETSELRYVVDRGRIYVSHLQNEIDGLQKAMDAANVDLCDARSKVDQHTAILSPIRRFPAEILGAIFQWTLPAANSRPPFLVQSPWNISRVCGLWRAIIISSPELWTNISVH